MPRFIVSFDHGINTDRDAGATIAERFEAFASSAGDVTVVTDHYKAGPFPRWNMVFGANQRIAEARAETLTHYHLAHPLAEITLVGHSNGCDIARRTALILADLGVPVTRLIFVAAPLKRSIHAAGLGRLVMTGTRIANWVMELDEVLAPDQAPIAALLRWPYGNAGKVGFDDADGWIRRFEDPNPEWRTYNRRFPWRHSEAFKGGNERDTFETILREIRANQPR